MAELPNSKSIPGQPFSRTDVYTKQERTRQSLLNATKKLVSEKDVDAISMADIARGAGVSRGTVYNYFETVEAALAAAAVELIDEFAVRQRQFAEIEPDPARAIAYGVYAALITAFDNPLLAWFYVRYAPRSTKVKAQLDAVMQHILEKGIADQRFSLSQSRIPATIIFIRGAVMHTLRTLLETKQADQLENHVVILVLRTLGLADDEAKGITQAIVADFRQIANSLNL